MNKDLLDRINKAFGTNLKKDDLEKPGFKFYIGKFQKSKQDNAKCRLFVDTIIEIKGFDNYSIGIRSYVLNNPKCDCCFAYLGYWLKKTYKKYNVENYEVSNIEQAFEETYKAQKLTLPCVSLTLNGVKYIKLLQDNTQDKVYVYRINNQKIEVVDKNLFQKALLVNGSDVITRDECEPLYETVYIYKNNIPFTVKEYLYGSYLSEYYYKILLELKKRSGSVDITKWAKV